MRVVIQKNMHTSPVLADNVNMFAVYDNADELVAAMWDRGDGTLALTRAGETDFERLCGELGLEKRTHLECVTL